jgi:hypothetical protein
MGDPLAGFGHTSPPRRADDKALADVQDDENLFARTGRTTPKAASWKKGETSLATRPATVSTPTV